jgi:UDP-N-acetyl-D-galactosamine dehydrogenase
MMSRSESLGLAMSVCRSPSIWRGTFPCWALTSMRSGSRNCGRGATVPREVTESEFAAAKNISFSADPEALKQVNFFIVTVPTPINQALQPDLRMLEKASATVGSALSKGDVVVYESTVYPGVTEDCCVPILADVSGLVFNRDFFAGYSPERINPGDHAHRLSEITKVTSGSTPEVAELVNQVYSRVVSAGTHKASSIRLAEASKVIENIQRDVNIALINELAQLFKMMGLETREILAAAGTKWNFHGYVPGLVGGHCIGVDPYYLTHKAQSIGFHPEMILAGRRINDGMAQWVALDVVKLMLRHKLEIGRARILVMGLTFKENCPDIRNSKIVDLVRELSSLAGEVIVYDPLANPAEVRKEYGIKSVETVPEGPFDSIILAVRHDQIGRLGADCLRAMLVPGGVLYDLKQVLPIEASDARL